MNVKLALILVGGLGTRLGKLTAETPKPLLDCAGRPFLGWVLRELCRYGIEEVILLAGFRSDKIESFCQNVQQTLPRPLNLKISIEPELAGTGGALWHARDLLQEHFLLLNGDSWFDANLARFLHAASNFSRSSGTMLLRRVEDSSRYGYVELVDGRVTAFHEKTQNAGEGLINSGISVLSRQVLEYASPKCSLERDIYPQLVCQGELHGVELEGYFVDIGIPDDYSRAVRDLPARLLRPAVFFDRDGILNKDFGWEESLERFEWIPGAKLALRSATDRGYHVFVVTNQAGVARGMYSEEDVSRLHEHLKNEVLAEGGTVDDIVYCPYHPEGTVERYRGASKYRKPEPPGVLLDLIRRWEVDVEGSLLVGDKPSDIQAASAAQVRGYLYKHDNLLDFMNTVVWQAATRDYNHD